jgi:hypothetical protein
VKKSEREKLVSDLFWASQFHHGRWPRPGELLQVVFNGRMDKIGQLTSDDFANVRLK